MHTSAACHKSLRLILLLNLPCILLVAGMMWVSHTKSAATAAERARFLPLDELACRAIESERDIEKLRAIARIQNIGASGSMEALLFISRKSTTLLLPGLLLPLISALVAGAGLRKPRPVSPAA
ncbi:MAG: hypothetical protein K1X78_06845 [Verrucomicrobiaceae bacterium]|nr:hypothetical protein [Verrucomicrobiaceae bacterium]